jgi:hypothetical protein
VGDAGLRRQVAVLGQVDGVLERALILPSVACCWKQLVFMPMLIVNLRSCAEAHVGQVSVQGHMAAVLRLLQGPPDRLRRLRRG